MIIRNRFSKILLSLGLLFGTSMTLAAGNKTTTTGGTSAGEEGSTSAGEPAPMDQATTPAPSEDTTTATDPTSMGMDISVLTTEEIQKIQTALNEQGSTVSVDGVMGPETKAALQEFQSQNNIDVGTDPNQLSSETLQRLGLEEIMQAH